MRRFQRAFAMSAGVLGGVLAGVWFLAMSMGLMAPGAELVERKWTVDGVERTALVYVPESAKGKPAPVIFNFHGHGGNQRFSSRAGYHTLWPEAVVVYPQGLATSGMTDPDGKNWEEVVRAERHDSETSLPISSACLDAGTVMVRLEGCAVSGFALSAS